MAGSSQRADGGWEPLFWEVFERSRNAIALLDEQRVFIDANGAACELFGVSRDEIAGVPFDRFVSSEDLPEMQAEFREDSVLHADDIIRERSLVRPDGSRVRAQFAVRRSQIGGRRLAVAVLIAAWPDNEPPPAARLGELTPREREILRFVALGHTSAEIADQLVISVETVRTHVSNAMAKTGARTRAQLVAVALAERHIAHDE